MLAIRLSRTGSKKQAHYRVVVIDSTAARDSRFVEILGHYNPRTVPAIVRVDRERIEHWLKVGARPSDTIRTLLARHVTGEPAGPERVMPRQAAPQGTAAPAAGEAPKQ